MSEAILQQTVVVMVRTLYPDLVLNLSLNGISLNGLSAIQKSQVIAQAKREGMETGIQDLSIYLPDAVVLNLEFKRPKGGIQSDAQKLIEAKLTALGHNYYLVRSIEEVLSLVAKHTSQDFRESQLGKLSIPNDTKVLTGQFLHWSKGTLLSIIDSKLRELYDIGPAMVELTT